MSKFNCVNLDKFMEKFSQLERKITEVNGKNCMLEIMMEDASRHMKFYLTKEKSFIEERDSLLVTLSRLQQTLQEQCNLRVENERLKNEMMDMKQQIEQIAEAGVWLLTVEAKDAELKRVLEKKDLELEEMKKRLKDQERQRQSELLKLQMEFGAKLARVQSTAQMSQQHQQQQHGSNLLPQTIFKRKLQFFQEEKNKEIVALRQRIKELEENQRAGLNDSRLKKRKI